jgi:hypothetical protein
MRTHRPSRCPPTRPGPADRCTSRCLNGASMPTSRRCGGCLSRSAPSTAGLRPRRPGRCVDGLVEPPMRRRDHHHRASCTRVRRWTGGASSTLIGPGCCGCERMFHCRADFGSNCRCAPTATVVAAIGNAWCSSRMALPVKSFGGPPVGFVAQSSAVSPATSARRQAALTFPRERSGQTDYGVPARS